MSVDVSVVIPTYKRYQLLYRCLRALYNQEFPPDRFEIIVVTDGPDAYTSFLNEIPDDEGPFLYVHALAERKGPAAARNAGWLEASGELILFTDDDCIPDPYWVSAYWKAYRRCLRKNMEKQLYPPAFAFRGNVSVPCSARPTDYEKNTMALATADFVTANCACTTTALKKVGGFDESFTMAWREDSELEFKWLEQFIPIFSVPDAIVVHPVRKAAWGVSLKEQRKSMFNALLYKKHPELFRKKIYRYPFWNYYAIIFFLIIAIISVFNRQYFITSLAAGGWALLTLLFIQKRLDGTSTSLKHISEIIFTSIFIPFLSVFWTLYGAIRFKTFFL